MTEVLSNLIGEIVEYRDTSGGCSDRWSRGFVRGVAEGSDNRGVVIVVEQLDEPSHEGQRFGELAGLSLYYMAVRPVKRCRTCWAWDHHSQMVREGATEDAIGSLEDATVSGWQHRKGKGCAK